MVDAEQFLQRCRLGQTERGSYVFTVACPMDAVPDKATLLDMRPFTRQVTSLLMRSLDRLTSCVTDADREAILQDAEREPSLSANLCEGVLDLVTDRGRHARRRRPLVQHLVPRSGRSAPDEGPDQPRGYPAHRVHRRQTSAGSAGGSDGLLRHRGDPRRAHNDDNRREGDVVVRVLDTEGEPRRARVELNPDDYTTAIRAHSRI